MKSERIVFRCYGQTVECYLLDGSWWCAVQGETEARGPFKSSGKAVEQGLTVAEKARAIRRRIKKRKVSATRSTPNTSLKALIRKATK